MPTVKQKRLIKALASDEVVTLRDAGLKAHYSIKSGNLYRNNIKKHIKDALKCEPDSIIKHYEALYATCLQSEDKATAKAILDSLCRINAMFKDKTDITLNKGINPENITQEMITQAKQRLLAREKVVDIPPEK